MNYLKHFNMICTHKYYVLKNCFRAGILWRGIVHDLSKFSPIEFISSSKYYTGTASPIDNEKKQTGRSLGWAHHKGRNSHHWQYWVDFTQGQPVAMKMPYDDIKELFCDMVGASKAYNKKDWKLSMVYDYYKKGNFILHADTKKFIDMSFEVLKSSKNEKEFLTWLKYGSSILYK